MTITIPITNHISLSISLLYCSSEEYCDCSIRVFRSDCSIRVYRSFKQVFRGPFMGPPGAPFRLGPGAKCPSCPPLWAALCIECVTHHCRAAHRGGQLGNFPPGPSLRGAPGGPMKGPLNTCLKDRYTLIEQSYLNTLIEQSQYSSEE